MGKAKVFIVDYKNQADYNVCFVKYNNEEKNEAIIEGGKLVKYGSQADVKVCIVDYKNQADILITRKNFPK